jgi:hypothetical protein
MNKHFYYKSNNLHIQKIYDAIQIVHKGKAIPLQA